MGESEYEALARADKSLGGRRRTVATHISTTRELRPDRPRFPSFPGASAHSMALANMLSSLGSERRITSMYSRAIVAPSAGAVLAGLSVSPASRAIFFKKTRVDTLRKRG